MSYIIEVYRGHQKPERSFGIYALYVMFYPQLVAGPIERPQNLLGQLRQEHRFVSSRVTDGLRLMAWGFFKKVVIADNLAIVVNGVYNQPQNHTGLTLLIATYFFAFQIYCDFSGYTDIARGAARIMGIELMENFKRPYFSKSISEFWKRWHISLSSWFKDYVYISLGGSRTARWKWYRNLMIVFLLSGLWHGANWTYVIWGALNGFYLVFSILSEGIRHKITSLLHIDRVPWLSKGIKVFITFHLICFSWIFFRARSLGDAFYILRHIPSGLRHPGISFSAAGITKYQLLLCLAVIGFLLVIQWIQRGRVLSREITQKPVLVRWGIYYAAIVLVLLFGAFTANSFIYFQF